MASGDEQVSALGADPKWLEILRASGWQTAAVAFAGVALLYLNAKKRLPVVLDSWVVEAVEVAVLVCGSLAVFSVGPHVAKKCNALWNWLAHRWAIRRAKHEIEKQIPSMSPKEREIIGYLLAINEKMFDYTIDGGAANTLISKRIVACAMLPGQSALAYGVTFKIPDYAWDVLVKHRAEFPNTWKPGEPFPYAISWMSR
jgi:hypothetical protein